MEAPEGVRVCKLPKCFFKWFVLQIILLAPVSLMDPFTYYEHLTKERGTFRFVIEGSIGTYAWNITVNNTYSVQMGFDMLRLNCYSYEVYYYYHPCSCYLLEIYDGGQENSDKLLFSASCDNWYSEYGIIWPGLTTSYSNNMLIILTGFSYDFYAEVSGFYSSVPGGGVTRDCGSNITGTDGVITFPPFPNNYTNLLVCDWLIDVDPSFRILVDLQEFDIESSDDCKYDSLQIRDGRNAFSLLYGHYCGSSNGPIHVATSLGSRLLLRFVSNWNVTGYGFKANWSTVCGEIYTEASGIVNSPSYPVSYRGTIQCEYFIVMREDYIARLTFYDVRLGDDCENNYIEVGDVDQESLSLLGLRYCGNTLPPEFTSTSNRMFIKFVTNSTSAFSATYKEELPMFTYVHHAFSSGRDFRFVRSGSIGIHVWNITVEKGYAVQLTFDSIMTYCFTHCSCSKIEIYDYVNEDSDDRLYVSTGQSLDYFGPGAITSFTNNVILVLTGDNTSDTYTNIRGSYDYVDISNVNRNCGGHINATEGTIKSPGYPNKYQNMMVCEWLITVDPAYRIVLNYLETDVEYSTNCMYDSLQIRDGNKISSPLRTFVCGLNYWNHHFLTSSTNQLFIKFVSDTILTRRGFKVNWTVESSERGNDTREQEFTAAPPNRFTSPLPGYELPAIDLDDTCGLNNRTWGFCRTTNSSCAFAKGAQSGSRTCQCVHGNIAIVDIVSGKRTCKEAPTELFSTFYQRTVQSSLTKLSPVLNISLNTGNIAMDPVSFKITLHPSDSFLAIPNSDSSTFSVITISDLPQEEKSYQFFLEAEMTYGDVIVKDITSLTINVTRVFPTPPPIAGIFVLDGTRKGSIVYDISADLGSVDGLDLSLVANPPTTVFKLDKNRIVCTEDVQLARLQNSQDSIGQLVNLSITSRTQVVITIQAVILVNSRSIEIQENSLLKVADFSSLVNSYDISLRPPYDDNVFGISASQSYVQLLRNLDFENWNRRNYIFRLSIVSKHNLQIKTEVETEVAVVDVNDIPPQFDRSTYFFTVPAGSPAGTIIGILRVTDRDTEPVIYTYVIDNSNYSSIFKVESSTGAITASQDIQNMNSSIVFNVTVSDGVNLSRKPALVIITVSKIQPEMVRLGKSLEADVVEGQDVGMFVINASVANYTGYQLLPDVIKYNFTINSTTGVVTTVSPIDREGELEINVFSVIAYHIEEACSFKIVGNVSISVKDINDNSPVFSDGGVYSVRLQEHTSPGTSVFTVTAMDRDEGENSTLNFNLTGADSHLFTINAQTGTISVTDSANLDREQKDTLQVTVIAEDGGSTLAPSARLSTNASLSLILEDVNDNSPEFKNSIYNFTVNENEPAGTSVGQVTAIDRDINENADIRYVLRSDGSWGFFRMNVTTGLLQTTQPIDREQYDNFTLTILAIDNGNPERTSSCLVAVKVMDRNDVTPLFKNIDNPRIIEEGSACATVPFLQVQAVDTDAGLNGQIYYTIDSNALLNIDNVTGNITCQAKGLDYENETHRDISVTVQAHDMGSEQQLMGMANIRVLLNDINDNQPEFLKSPYYISIPSATFRYVNSTVYVVMFQDRDSGANGEVDLTLNATSSLGENLLWIDDRGVIRVKRDIYGTESGKELVYEVVATDRGQSRLSNRTNFTLIVDASNATDEKIIDPDISISVEERSCPPSGAVVGRLSVDLQYTATFYLFNTDDTFTVNSTTGELLCHADLDRETKERHQLFVNVTAGNHHTYTVVVVTVTDVNDNAPKFELMQHRLVTQVEESASNGYFIITVSALDNDAGDNGTIVYSILEPKEPFAINATHGGIFVQTSLNRESVSQYSLTILAKDKGPQPLNSTTTVEITILDVNDNAPTFNSNLSREFFVPENVDSLFEVGRMEATDPDYGLNGRVTYSITNVGQCPFIMHDEGAIGIIKLGDSKTLDFEMSRDYTCTIQASDLGDPRLNTTLDVTIIVTDVNDNAPVFHDVKQSVNVSRDANTSYVIVPMLNVTDEDTGKNAEVAFSFVSVENSSTSTERDVLNYFDLDAVSGKIGIRKSLRDLPRDAINLTVQAQDQGDPILSAVVQIEVVITDNNTAPQFNQNVYKYVLIEEDKGFVGTLLTVSAFDYENHVHVPECNCTYSIISVEAEKDFNATFLAIDNKTGAVTLQQAIDREESGGIINVILQATDHGLPPKSDQALLEITVSDINDNAPQFEQLLYQAIITKSHCERGQPFFKVKARDSDSPPNDNTTYILAEKTFQGIEINRTTGELILTESVCPQRYHNEKYTAIVIAYDGYWNSSSTNIFITVNHSDSNLHEPVFASPKYVTSLSSTAKVGTTLQLVNFYANDSDGDAINYNITSGNIVCPKSVFGIDSVTGVITVESEIEYLNIPYYNLTVTAVDTGDFNSYFRRTGTTVVEINIPDLTKTCYKPAEVEQLSSEAEQFQLFRGLFIGLAILLGIVVVLGVAFFYKWRVAKSDTQQNNSEIRFEMDPTGEQKGSTKVSSVDTRGTPPRLPPREQGYSGMEPGLNNGAVDSEGYLSPSEPSQSRGEQQLTSADSQQFPQRTGRMTNTTGYLPLSASDSTRFAEQTPEKSRNRSEYLTPSHVTSSRDQESTAYFHPLPRPSLSYYNPHVQATVDLDDVKPSFSPLAAHGSQQQNEHQFQPSFASQSLADGRRLVSTMQPELGHSSREGGDAFRSEAEVRRDPRGIRPTRNLRGDDSNNDRGYRPMLFKLDRNAQ